MNEFEKKMLKEIAWLNFGLILIAFVIIMSSGI